MESIITPRPNSRRWINHGTRSIGYDAALNPTPVAVAQVNVARNIQPDTDKSVFPTEIGAERNLAGRLEVRGLLDERSLVETNAGAGEVENFAL